MFPNGTLKWTFVIAAGVVYNAATLGDDGEVYIGSKGGDLLALHDDGSHATLLWSVATTGELTGSVTRARSGLLAVLADDGSAYLLTANGT